jgi:hypothetical protein
MGEVWSAQSPGSSLAYRWHHLEQGRVGDHAMTKKDIVHMSSLGHD